MPPVWTGGLRRSRVSRRSRPPFQLREPRGSPARRLCRRTCPRPPPQSTCGSAHPCALCKPTTPEPPGPRGRRRVWTWGRHDAARRGTRPDFPLPKGQRARIPPGPPRRQAGRLRPGPPRAGAEPCRRARLVSFRGEPKPGFPRARGASSIPKAPAALPRQSPGLRAAPLAPPPTPASSDPPNARRGAHAVPYGRVQFPKFRDCQSLRGIPPTPRTPRAVCGVPAARRRAPARAARNPQSGPRIPPEDPVRFRHVPPRVRRIFGGAEARAALRDRPECPRGAAPFPKVRPQTPRDSPGLRAVSKAPRDPRRSAPGRRPAIPGRAPRTSGPPPFPAERGKGGTLASEPPARGVRRTGSPGAGMHAERGRRPICGVVPR